MQLLLLLVETHPLPHHIFMGFELGEWVEIIGIVTFIAGIIAWIVRIAIVNPTNVSNDSLAKSIDQLSEKVSTIGMNGDKVHAEHDRRLDEHEVHLARHDEEIKTLFSRTGENDHK